MPDTVTSVGAGATPPVLPVVVRPGSVAICVVVAAAVPSVLPVATATSVPRMRPTVPTRAVGSVVVPTVVAVRSVVGVRSVVRVAQLVVVRVVVEVTVVPVGSEMVGSVVVGSEVVGLVLVVVVGSVLVSVVVTVGSDVAVLVPVGPVGVGAVDVVGATAAEALSGAAKPGSTPASSRTPAEPVAATATTVAIVRAELEVRTVPSSPGGAVLATPRAATATRGELDAGSRPSWVSCPAGDVGCRS